MHGKIFGMAAVLISVVFLCSGCSAVQVRDRAYLQAIEVNTDDRATFLQLHDFETEGLLAEGDGKNFDSALQNASVPLGKELFLGHLELIAYGVPSCTARLSQWMDDYRLSPSCKVLGISTQETLREKDTLLLTEQLRRAENSGILPKTDLFTILRELDGASGTALMPITDGDKFAVAVVTAEDSLGLLSEEAAVGLCWLRGDNYPEQLALSENESYAVSYGAIRTTADIVGGHAVVHAVVHLRGEGDFEKTAALVKKQCEAAIRETVEQKQADVFDIEACLRSHCYAYMTKTPWDEVLEQLVFEVQVVERL